MRPAQHEFSPAATATATAKPPAGFATATARCRDLTRRLGPVGPLAIVTAVLPVIGGIVLYGRLSALAAWLRSGAAAAPLLCVLLFAVTGGLAVVPTYAMSVLCGWAFGF